MLRPGCHAGAAWQPTAAEVTPPGGGSRPEKSRGPEGSRPEISPPWFGQDAEGSLILGDGLRAAASGHGGHRAGGGPGAGKTTIAEVAAQLRLRRSRGGLGQVPGRCVDARVLAVEPC